MGQQDVLYPEQASFEFGTTDKSFTHFDKRSHNEDAHPDGFRTIQNIGSHDSAMLGEGVRQKADVSLGCGRKLRPDIKGS